MHAGRIRVGSDALLLATAALGRARWKGSKATLHFSR